MRKVSSVMLVLCNQPHLIFFFSDGVVLGCVFYIFFSPNLVMMLREQRTVFALFLALHRARAIFSVHENLIHPLARSAFFFFLRSEACSTFSIGDCGGAAGGEAIIRASAPGEPFSRSPYKLIKVFACIVAVFISFVFLSRVFCLFFCFCF